MGLKSIPTLRSRYSLMPISRLSRQTRRRLLAGGAGSAPDGIALAEEAKEVSQDEYNRQVYNNGIGGKAFQDASEAMPKGRLWDVIDQDWTGLLPTYRHSYYLRKVAVMCTGCSESSMWEKDIRVHIQKVKDDVELHSHGGVKIEYLMQSGRSVPQCTGCGRVFMARPDRAREHIKKVLASLAPHKKASPQTVLRFRMQPENLVAEQSPLVALNGVADETAPVASTGERTKRARKRNRKRGKKLEASSG